jgi:thiol-disulfide isomerase/thioredoxin
MLKKKFLLNKNTMKLSIILCLLILLSLSYGECFSQNHVIELPLSEEKGYSVFYPSFARKSPEISKEKNSVTFKLKEELSGIPAKFINIKRFHIIFNEKQYYYQKYLNQEISKEEYEQFKKWHKLEEPSEEDAAKKLNKISIYLLAGEDKTGNSVWMADTNMDNDFSDEKIQPLIKTEENPNTYKAIANNAVDVTFQMLEKGHIVENSCRLAFVDIPGHGYYFNNPTHYTAEISLGDQAYELKINRDHFLFFGPEYNHSEILIMADSLKGKLVKTGSELTVAENQYFTLNDNTFQYLGIDLKQNIAKVRRINMEMKDLRSAQMGSVLPQFTGEDFMTGQDITTDQFQGKLVYLDFWATWCSPCIAEFPKLKDLVKEYGKDQFEIIGIIGHSQPEAIKKVIERYEVTWKQIHSDEIVNQYQVNSYPSTFLISPEGKIIAINLRGEALEKKLAELIR